MSGDVFGGPSRAWGPRAALLAAFAIALTACRGDGTAGAGGGGAAGAEVRARAPLPERFGLGRAATATEIAAWDIDANPAGVGLPPGRGTHAEGAVIYAQKCAMCHGVKGEGLGTGPAAFPKLVGREPRVDFPFGKDLKHVRTIGNYWPYATTIYDYINRAMPLNAPGYLSPTEVYGLTAWLLAENEIVARDAIIDARTLPQVKMPASERFVKDDRTGGAGFR